MTDETPAGQDAGSAGHSTSRSCVICRTKDRLDVGQEQAQMERVGDASNSARCS